MKLKAPLVNITHNGSWNIILETAHYPSIFNYSSKKIEWQEKGKIESFK